VKPLILAEVEFQEWTSANGVNDLRLAVFHGIAFGQLQARPEGISPTRSRFPLGRYRRIRLGSVGSIGASYTLKR
jgi:hypothetical protein